MSLSEELEAMVAAMAKACPRCGAKPGDPCVNGYGLIRTPRRERRVAVDGGKVGER